MGPIGRFLASDHAPHSSAERDRGISGVPQLDTYGSFTTWLMHEHGFTPKEIVRVCSHNPGKYIRSFVENDGFGEIKTGNIGSLTIIDTVKKTLIQEQNLYTKAKWSPFLGTEFAGSVKYAIIRGRVY
jgi:dihydroorotase